MTPTAEDAQAESPITTTYTIIGRFVKDRDGRYKALGTDSPPLCQPWTETFFSLEFDSAS